MSECPNCGDGGCKYVVSRVALGQYCTEDGSQCQECGAILWKNGELTVPRCSQPAEVKELPDAEGDWWWLDKKGELEPIRVTRIDAYGTVWVQFIGAVGFGKCLPGSYVRAVPPIVKPEPEPVDEDAEWLREQAEICKHDHEQDRTPRFRRIADRLERQAKETQ